MFNLGMTKELWVASLRQIQSALKVLVLPSSQNSNKSFYSAFQNEAEHHVKILTNGDHGS